VIRIAASENLNLFNIPAVSRTVRPALARGSSILSGCFCCRRAPTWFQTIQTVQTVQTVFIPPPMGEDSIQTIQTIQTVFLHPPPDEFRPFRRFRPCFPAAAAARCPHVS